MLKKLGTCFLFILFSASTYSQIEFKIDSVRSLLAKETVDTIKAKYINQLIKFNLWDGRNLEALKLAQQAKLVCKKSKFQTAALAKNYQLMNWNYSRQNNFANGSRCLDTCISLRQQLGDKKGIAEAMNSKGIAIWQQADYNRALTQYMNALKEAESLRDTSLYLKIYNNIGIVYYSLKRLELAVDYYKKVLNYTDSATNALLLANTLDNIGITYLELKQPEIGLNYTLRSLAIKQALKDERMIAISYLNIGNVYHAKKDFRSALVYYQKSKLIKEKNADTLGLTHCYNDIASVYAIQGNYSLAKQYQLKGLDFALKIHFTELIKELSKGLAESNYALKNYKEAYDFFKKYSDIKDTLFTSESSKQITEIETKYQSEKKEQENVLLKQENDIHVLEGEKKNTDLKRQKITIILVSVGLFLMLVLAVFIYRGYREKQKANKIISEQKVLVEEKQKEILDSIHYAKRIQTALITSEKYIDKNLERLNKS